jgi:hypothetical protein
MRRALFLFVLVAFVAAGCCTHPDYRPAFEKIKKSMEHFEKDLTTYWSSDAFMEGKPEELREEFRQNKMDLLKETKETIDTALDPKNAPNEAAKEEAKVDG